MRLDKSCDWIALPQALGPTNSPTFKNVKITGQTANRLLSLDGSNQVTSVADLTSWVAGTANQIIATDDTDGTITLSTPQDIATTSNVTFNTITSTDHLIIDPGSDIDTSIIEVSVTGTPTLSWDESTDTFDFNKGAVFTGAVGINRDPVDYALEVDGDIAIPSDHKMIFGVDGSGTGEYIENSNFGIAIYGASSLILNATNTPDLRINQDTYLSDKGLYLRSATDTNDGLFYTTSFAGTTIDGPALFGNFDGVLGTRNVADRIALAWDSSQNVTIKNDLTVDNETTVTGALTAGSLQVDDIILNANTFTTASGTNADINISPNGTGRFKTTADYYITDNTFYLRSAGVTTAGLKYTSSFGGVSTAGPVIFGDTGGLLGTTSSSTDEVALEWNDNQDVLIKNKLFSPLATFGASSDGGATVSISGNLNIGANVYDFIGVFNGIYSEGHLLTQGKLGIGVSGSPPSIPFATDGIGKVFIEGPDSSTTGPHVEFTTPSDNYPLMQIRNWVHDDVEINFDAYLDSNQSYISSDAGSNFQIKKNGDKFGINYNTGTTAGSSMSFSNGILIDTGGNVGVNTSDTSDSFTIENPNTTGSLSLVLNNSSTTKLYTGVRLERQGLEEWFTGMDSTNNAFHIRYNGVSNYFSVSPNGGFTLGSPTGGFKGYATMNIQNDIYKNNSQYNNPDYVLEKYYTGRIEKFKDNPGADTYQWLSLENIEEIMKNTWKLPRMSKDSMGMFARGDFLLEKIEELFLHVIEKNKRIKKLEELVEKLYLWLT